MVHMVDNYFCKRKEKGKEVKEMKGKEGKEREKGRLGEMKEGRQEGRDKCIELN